MELNIWWAVVNVIKLFLGNLNFTKIKKLKKVCSGVRTCTKMLKQYNTISKQNYTLTVLIALKWPIFAVSAQGGKLDFLDFL